MSDRVKINTGEELVLQDMTDIQALHEQALYDRVFRRLLGDPTTAIFFGNDCEVTSAGSMDVEVGVGDGYQYVSSEADDDEPKFKPVRVTVAESFTLDAAHASLPRIDIISIKADRVDGLSQSRYVMDGSANITSNSVNKRSYASYDAVYTAGTPNASPIAPSVPSGYIKIAEIAVAASAGSVSSGDITDTREIYTLYDPGVTMPIGSIIAHYDYNGSLTVDSSKWKYCDGSIVTITGIGSQTLPDLSNRYLVGFGTEGGGDVDSAAWATTAVGNASHQVNLQHSHTVDSHTHDLGNHTHTGAAHTHSGGSHSHTAGSLVAEIYVDSADALSGAGGGTNNIFANSVSSSSWSIDSEVDTANLSPAFLGTSTNGTNIQGSTSSTSAGTTGSTTPGAGSTPSSNTSGSTSPGTDSQLSTTQSIQPRSVRVRFIMRVA